MIGLILVAGGVGTRMGQAIPKQYLELGGEPILCRTLRLFTEMEEISECVVVCQSSYRSLVPFPDTRFADPGGRRQDSVANGLAALSPKVEWVVIHDAVRPFVTQGLVRSALAAARQHGAATLGLPVRYTVKEVDKNGFVTHTLHRERIWEIQTPQVVKRHLLEEALQRADQEGWQVTDDASLVEQMGYPVKVVSGHPSNIKITTPEDWLLAQAMVEK